MRRLTSFRIVLQPYRRAFGPGGDRGGTILLVLIASLAHATELKPKTREAFDHYVKVAETRIQSELDAAAKGSPFLDFELKDPAQQKQVREQLQRGETVIEKVDENGRSIANAPNGLIHHWRATIFIPGADMKSTMALIQDYDHHKDVYKPQVIASKLLSKSIPDPAKPLDGTFKAYLRFYTKKVLSATLNTEHVAQYTTLTPTRAIETSHTTRVAEVDDAGTPKEHEKPVGDDNGYLWALNSYWRLEQKDGGTYVQCEAISLTRDVPTGLGWLIKPLITEVPRESLHTTLDQTRAFMMRKK